MEVNTALEYRVKVSDIYIEDYCNTALRKHKCHAVFYLLKDISWVEHCLLIRTFHVVPRVACSREFLLLHAPVLLASLDPNVHTASANQCCRHVSTS